MKTVKSKILVQVVQETCMQSIGQFKTPINTEGYERAKVISVGEEIEDSVLKAEDMIYIYANCGKDFIVPETGEKYRLITINEVMVVLD